MIKTLSALLLASALLGGGCGGSSGDASDGGGPDGGADATRTVDAERPDAAPPDARAVPVTTTLKVMTINLRNDSDEWERRLDLIADEIVRLDPDLVGLQEIRISVGQLEALLARIDARVGAKTPRYVGHEQLKIGLVGLGGEGIGVLSRFPIEETGFDDLLLAGRLQVVARVRLAEDVAVDFYNAHLHTSGTTEELAAQSTRMLAGMAARGAGLPTILTGDMNAVPTSETMGRLILGGFVDSFAAVHGALAETIGNTSPIVLAEGAVQNPRRRIDYVLARDPVRGEVVPIASVITHENHDDLGFYPSDHLGVMTTYEITVR